MKNNKPIYVVLGTRAQTIKMAPVMRELEAQNMPFTLLYTQQHKVTITDLLENFDIKTKPISIIERKDEAKTIKLFAGWLVQILLITLNPFSVRNIFTQGKGLILTHGDTATTSWSAFYGRLHGQKVMHIESGLRSFNLTNPFPEEIQRLISFRFSNYYVAPNEWALNNLKKYKGEKINSQANTMYESLTYIIKKKNPEILSKLKKKFKLPNKYALVSIHRYENIFKEERFKEIMGLLEKISKDINLVFVLHPPTEKQLEKTDLSERLEQNKKIQLIPRQDFQNFAYITDLAEFVITDGGSNQEELSYIGKPTILFREYTERTEGLDENVVLSKFDHDLIFDFIKNYKDYQRKPLNLKVTPSKLIVEFITRLIEN
jgi:UDP-N-acetylglucosamine 2-epimerase (non-hydrolysing)